MNTPPVDFPSYVILSAMITPALFMTATGSLMISTSHRMARIVDRIRILNDQIDAIDRGQTTLDFLAERYAHLVDQLDHQQRRADFIRVALVLLYMAFGAFVGTSLALGLDVLLGHSVVALPTATAICGVSLMLVASVYLVREATEALYGSRLEVRFYRELRSRRPSPLGESTSAS